MGYSNVTSDLNVYGTTSLSDLSVRGNAIHYGNFTNYGNTVVANLTASNLTVTGNFIVTATNTQLSNSLSIINQGTTTAFFVNQNETPVHIHNVAEFYDNTTVAMIIDPNGNVAIHQTRSDNFALSVSQGASFDSIVTGTLSGTTLTATFFTGVNFTGSTFYGGTSISSPAFSGSGFTGGTFSGSTVGATSVTATNFTGTNFSGSTFNGGFSGTFTGSGFTGGTFYGTTANLTTSANIVTLNTASANLTTENVGSLNVFTGANVTWLTVSGGSNLVSANIVTLNTASANLTTANLLNLNVYTSANIFTANLVTANIANIFTTNIVGFVGSQWTSIGSTSIYYINPVGIGSSSAPTANLVVTGNLYVTQNITTPTANLTTANVSSLNVFTGANVTWLTVSGGSNLVSANIVTLNTSSANLTTENVGSLNVFTGANVTWLTVSGGSNLVTANILTINSASANIVTLNTSSANLTTANLLNLNVYTSANLVNANVYYANIVSGNITSNVNGTFFGFVSGVLFGLFSGSAFTGGTFYGGAMTGTATISAATGFTGAAYTGGTFYGTTANLTSSANIVSANITSSNVSGTHFGVFSGSAFTGGPFYGGAMTGTATISAATGFTGAAFTGGTFSGSTVGATSVTATNFTGTNFSGSTFTGSSFNFPSGGNITIAGSTATSGYYLQTNGTQVQWAAAASTAFTGSTVFVTGQVSIGSSFSATYPLSVNGTAGTTGSQAYSNLAYNTGGWYQAYNAGGTRPLQIYTPGNIGCAEVDLFSDERIKTNIKDSDSRADLELVSSLQPRTFRYIDPVQYGEKTYNGFIAQEVREIIPSAVNTHEGCIPDIFQVPEKVFKNSCQFKTKIEGIQVGDIVRVFDGPNELFLTVITFSDFEINFDSELKTSRVFVYGRKVKDFCTISYERIIPLLVSSIKELRAIVEKNQ